MSNNENPSNGWGEQMAVIIRAIAGSFDGGCGVVTAIFIIAAAIVAGVIWKPL